ncbi:DUF1642 domain-containing protein [Listeria booriae]|uniref:DUF1642 domain-containing protein n=1 Tax=Listeria booriae TaxID=1552123 RepID=UPI0016236636|nr:DUF1642 domain-containing protein [Listeria booriae]MBC1286930.1 DUF1642 domain-containing protein [Listeria booriae]
MTHKFKVGDRVHIIFRNELKTGVVISTRKLDIDIATTNEENAYLLDVEGLEILTPEYNVAPAPALVVAPQWFDDAYKELTKYNWDEYAQKVLLHFIARTGFGNQFSIVESDGTQQYCEGATDYVRDNRFDLIRAVLDGYEVEKEPLYEIVIVDGEDRQLLFGEDAYTFQVRYESESHESWKKRYSEREIKDIDTEFSTNYWAFAVQTEEVSE